MRLSSNASFAGMLLLVLVKLLSILPCSKAFTSTLPAFSDQSLRKSLPRYHYALSSIQERAAAASEITTNEISTIQILMSDTGGGHRASANALKDALDVLYPGKIRCDIVDIYTDYGPFWPFNDYVNMYKLMAKYTWSWALFFKLGATPFGIWLNAFVLELVCFNSFKKCMARDSCGTGKRADMVISVHPLCQDLPLRILAELDTDGKTRDISAKSTPFCTVVTDLGGAHPTWFHCGVDKCFVPSDVLYAQARDRGLAASQIVQHGLPIRRGFWDNSGVSTSDPTVKDVESLRAKLGLDKKMPVVLIVGGGDGMGNIVSMAKAMGDKLGNAQSKAQMVVVCGNNEEAEAELGQVTWGPGVKSHIRGFVNNMDEWMTASDVLVTKAGPGTIAEASICGLPCMLFAFLPGQEEGNIPFVENAGFGKYSGDPAVIADTVSIWLSSPGMLAEMKQNALKAARPRATLDIAKDLGAIVFKAKESQRKEKLVQVSTKRSSR
jgi:1,2-diacylglycerol 3-beta-galactosyltransferase